MIPNHAQNHSPLRWAYINMMLDIATPNLFSLFIGIDDASFVYSTMIEGEHALL